MNSEQLKTIVGLIAGCEATVVTMADYLSKLDLLDKASLAEHFENTAQHIPEETQQRQLIALVLRQVAMSLRSVKPTDPDAMQKLFH
jgi:hypothetical protein